MSFLSFFSTSGYVGFFGGGWIEKRGERSAGYGFTEMQFLCKPDLHGMTKSNVEWQNGGMAEWRNGGNGGRMAEWLNGRNGYLPTIFMVHANDNDDDNTDTFKSFIVLKYDWGNESSMKYFLMENQSKHAGIQSVVSNATKHQVQKK